MSLELLNNLISVVLVTFMLATMLAAVGLYAVYKLRETQRRPAATVVKLEPGVGEMPSRPRKMLRFG